MWTLNERASTRISMADYPAPAGQVIGAVFDDAVDNNPVPLVMQAMELNGLRKTGYKMSKQEADDEAARNGVKVTVHKDGITQPALNFLIQRRKDEVNMQVLQSRSPGGAGVMAGQFAAGLAGAMLDPINVAAGFIPVMSGTKYAAALETAVGAGQRAGLRLGVGAGEGLVGAAAVEIPTLTLRGDLQDDYTLGDSLANIAFGTFASAGLRAGGGYLKDVWGGVRRAREADADAAVQRLEDFDTSLTRDLDEGTTRGGGFSETDVAFNQFNRDFVADRQYASEAFITLEREIADAEARSIEAGRQADAAIYRRMQRTLDAEYDAGTRLSTEESPGVTPDQMEATYQRARTKVEADRKLLSSAEAAERRFATMDMEDAKKAIAEGKGKIIVPRNALETEVAISDTTHAAALRASVAQAIEGRRVDPTAVVRTDPVFGPQRLDATEARDMAASTQRVENNVSADRGASERADAQLKLSVPKAAEAPRADTTPPHIVELENLVKDAEAKLKRAGREAPAAKEEKADLYEKAWNAVGDCLEGRAI